MKVFGQELNVLVREEPGHQQILCSFEVLKKLIDAHDIAEPVWWHGEPHLIRTMDFCDLEGARLGYDLFVLNLTLHPFTQKA